MLNSTVNTPKMGERVKRAASKIADVNEKHVAVFFEHGNWWVHMVSGKLDGAEYSVVDAEGGESVDGFDLEEIASPYYERE